MPPVVVPLPPPAPTSISRGAGAAAPSDHDKVKQLAALLRSELDGSGQLSAIKAQLASTASNLVLRKSSSSLKPSTAQIPEPTLSILAECLSFYGFRHSLNTLLAESGVSRDSLRARPQLAQHFAVADVDGKECGSLLDIITKRPTAVVNNPKSNSITAPAPLATSLFTSQPGAATNPIGPSTRTPPPALAPLRTTSGSSSTASATAPAPAAVVVATSTAPAAASNVPPTHAPPTQPTTLANVATARPHTAPPLTPLPPTPPKVTAKDLSPPQPAALAPLAHPISMRSQAPDPEPRSIGASPQSTGAIDLSQLSSVPSQITSEDLPLSGGSSPASTSVLSTEDYSVSVSVAHAGGMGGEFRGLGLDKRQVGAWLADKDFHMKP
ncbi:hypothetical protein BCR44DRAFT_24311 [Catenaria anguillulae PL171]|uniref:LisH domain-containing protein n=1 Tax=Catenaria anguillulae PL171 TaxID=765915 RepID=A0A1Y2HCQ7_9FUNG|nr:hypothetical protein BCR44DRAFT_24311 [Catenaria anguillulae PL171]